MTINTNNLCVRVCLGESWGGAVSLQARETERLDSSCVGVLPFACLLTVTDKIGRCLKISSPGAKTTKDRALVLLLPSLVRLRLIMLPRVAAAWRSGPVRAFHHCNFLENVPGMLFYPKGKFGVCSAGSHCNHV